jgi:predicted nucleotide-binding protein (sugar kinase/HSP70/actin superfamily)
MKFSIYQVGTSAIATSAFARKIGINMVVMPQPNKETINIGVLYAPEFSCFPFKVLLGLLMQALDKGVTLFIIPQPRGIIACQLADFGMAQKYILEKTGKKFEIIFIDSLNPKEVLKKFKKYNNDLTLKDVTEGLLVTSQKLALLENVETYYRQIYISSKKKKAELFRNKWIKIVDKTDSIITLYMLSDKIYTDFKKYPAIDKNILKIAVIGDIYALNEPVINNNIFERLCDLGIYSEKGITLNAFSGLNSNINPKEMMLDKEVRNYLRHNVGGFAQETVKSAISYAERGYDGIIQIYPFSCMPEITVRNILPKISTDYNIPILYLPIDEQTGDAGFTTRIEAFVDLIQIRKNKNNFAHKKEDIEQSDIFKDIKNSINIFDKPHNNTNAKNINNKINTNNNNNNNTTNYNNTNNNDEK